MRFVWQVTYREALLSFRSALLRYAVKLRQLYATRKYTSSTNQAPAEAYTRYPEVIRIRNPEGNHALTPSFQQEIDRAINIANAAVQG